MNIGEGGGGRGFESFPNPCAYMMMMMPIGMAWHGMAWRWCFGPAALPETVCPQAPGQQHRVCVCRCMAAQPESLVASSGKWRSASSPPTSRPPHDDSLRTIPPANIKREGGGESPDGRTNRNLHATLAGVSGDSALRGTYIHTYTRSTGGGMQCTQARQGNMHLSTRCCSPATCSLSRPLGWTCNRNRNRPPDPCVRERHHVRFFFFFLLMMMMMMTRPSSHFQTGLTDTDATPPDGKATSLVNSTRAPVSCGLRVSVSVIMCLVLGVVDGRILQIRLRLGGLEGRCPPPLRLVSRGGHTW